MLTMNNAYFTVASETFSLGQVIQKPLPQDRRIRKVAFDFSYTYTSAIATANSSFANAARIAQQIQLYGSKQGDLFNGNGAALWAANLILNKGESYVSSTTGGVETILRDGRLLTSGAAVAYTVQVRLVYYADPRDPYAGEPQCLLNAAEEQFSVKVTIESSALTNMFGTPSTATITVMSYVITTWHVDQDVYRIPVRNDKGQIIGMKWGTDKAIEDIDPMHVAKVVKYYTKSEPNKAVANNQTINIMEAKANGRRLILFAAIAQTTATKAPAENILRMSLIKTDAVGTGPVFDEDGNRFQRDFFTDGAPGLGRENDGLYPVNFFVQYGNRGIGYMAETLNFLKLNFDIQTAATDIETVAACMEDIQG